MAYDTDMLTAYQKTGLVFGPLAGAILLVGVASLALMIPEYSHVRQTVSEIGEVGSPARIPFTLLLCIVSICTLIFAWAVRDLSLGHGRSPLTAYLVGSMAISIAGVGIFAFPDPLHNVFGISELIGYQAPLVLAITWRKNPEAKFLCRLSWLFYFLIVVAIAINLSPMLARGSLALYVKPYYGIAQRTLFAAWFMWMAVIGILLYRPKSRY